MNGLIVINKQKGMTSFDVVAKLRKIFQTKKIGHAGTLDPSVEGVLVVAIGKATKLIEELQTRPKTYIGEITLGFSTETEDLDGKIIEEKPLEKQIADETIDNAIASFLGKQIQTPPIYSAVKVKGKRLYEYARNGQTVEIPSREIFVYDYQRTSEANFNDAKMSWDFQATVSKGTYIRTLISDTGKKLGYPATMTYLKRTEGSGFSLSDAVSLDELKQLTETELMSMLLPIENVLNDNQRLDIEDDDDWFKIKNGRKMQFDCAHDKDLNIYRNDELKVVYQYCEDEELWKVKYMFAND